MTSIREALPNEDKTNGIPVYENILKWYKKNEKSFQPPICNKLMSNLG